MDTTKKTFTAIVTNLGVEKTKSNGAKYTTHVVKFTEGATKGLTYWANRTTVNAEGAIKTPCVIGETVELHRTLIVNPDGSTAPFFEIQRGTEVTATADLLAAMDAQSI